MSLLSEKQYETHPGPNPLVAGFVGGGLAVLLSKLFDLLAAGYAGHGYEFEFPGNILTALFIMILVVVLALAKPRRSELKTLIEENDRRLKELDSRLEKLWRETRS